MAFQRKAMRARTGQDADPGGGGVWIYEPTNGDSLATVEGANFFLDFQEALPVGATILVIIGTTTYNFEAVTVSNRTTLTIVKRTVGA